MTGSNEEPSGHAAESTESLQATETAWWDATLDELALVADERRGGGWKLHTVEAGAAAPVAPDASDDDSFGLVYELSDGVADDLSEFLDGTTVDEFEAFRRTVDSTCFLVTELRDTERQRCVLVAGTYDVADAEALAAHVTAVGHLFSRFQGPDGSVIATVRHDNFEKLLPPSLTE